MKLLNFVRQSCSILNLKNGIDLNSMTIKSCFNNISIRSTQYRASNLWSSVLSVSSQGAKKGRGKGRAGSLRKNLNVGQEIGTGKLKVEWPGLNAPLLKDRKISSIKLLGEDTERETRLRELRSKMDRFRRMSIAPNERGWTGGTMNGKSLGPPTERTEIDLHDFDTRVLEYKIVATVTSVLGKKRSPTCFVVTGNKNGIIGFGSGKASLAQAAIRTAKLDATKKLIKIDLFENRTLFHNFYQEFYYTKIYAERKPAGYGLKCHRVIKTICELLGLKDIHVKVEGSMNTRNMAKAFVNGLLKQKKYEEIANEKGLHVVEMKPERHYYPEVLASPTNKEARHDYELKHEFEKDINLYVLNQKFMKPQNKKTPFYNEYPLYKRYLMRKERDTQQKLTKAQRMSALSDDSLLALQYPRKPVPKPKDEAETTS